MRAELTPAFEMHCEKRRLINQMRTSRSISLPCGLLLRLFVDSLYGVSARTILQALRGGSPQDEVYGEA